MGLFVREAKERHGVSERSLASRAEEGGRQPQPKASMVALGTRSPRAKSSRGAGSSSRSSTSPQGKRIWVTLAMSQARELSVLHDGKAQKWCAATKRSHEES